jgi:hypothetical protein
VKQTKFTTASKTKTIDLGALQDHHNSTKKQWLNDAKALEKAQQAFEESVKAYHEAIDALKAGSRAVLG